MSTRRALVGTLGPEMANAELKSSIEPRRSLPFVHLATVWPRFVDQRAPGELSPEIGRSRDSSRKARSRIVRSMTDDDGRAWLDAQLRDLGVAYELFPCDPALADTAAFCAAYGFDPEDSANTIVVIGKSDPPRFAACVTLAPYRLDVNRTVRDRLGTRKASFAPAEETARLTGMLIGGVTVFGLPPELPIWVDARVMERERIILGGGSRSWKVISTPAILRALPRMEVVEGLATDPRAS
jgi:prolyl-tRNA editing enzyme YbaK/EbsC (Cys-tRNA(Pro) deacylase)